MHKSSSNMVFRWELLCPPHPSVHGTQYPPGNRVNRSPEVGSPKVSSFMFVKKVIVAASEDSILVLCPIFCKFHIARRAKKSCWCSNLMQLGPDQETPDVIGHLICLLVIWKIGDFYANFLSERTHVIGI